VAHRDGVYYATCKENGIQMLSPVERGGGALFKRNDLAQTWHAGSAALATDGVYTLMGGADYTASTALWMANEGTNAINVGLTAQYRDDLRSSTTALDTGYFPRFMTMVDGINYIVGSNSDTAHRLYAYQVQNSTSNGFMHWIRNLTLSGTQLPNGQPVTDGEHLFVPRTSVISIYDTRNTTNGFTTRATISTPTTIGPLAISRNRLYAGGINVATSPQKVYVYDVTNPASINALSTPTAITLPAKVEQVTGMAVAGGVLFYTFKGTSTSGIPWGVGFVQLAAVTRDGNGATVSTDFVTASQPLREPSVVGDTLYVAQNLGITTYDINPVWQAVAPAPAGTVPKLLSASNNVDPIRNDLVRLVVQGPWAYMMGGTYRVFDLR
jgi:hypothetical protein